MDKLEKRMYSLVLYNISPIQQGIQSGHSNDEHSLVPDEDYLDWVNNWKTVIVLNGGTSNSSEENPGTMEQHLENLAKHGVKAVPFYEPDLNNSLTSISFVVDERVFNYKKYPNERPHSLWKFTDDYIPSSEWIESIGGGKNYFLREFLRNFRLA